MAAKKKKSDDGYEYFQKMALDGFIDLNIKSKETKELIKKASNSVTKKQKYTYRGPVYRYDKLIMENVELSTQAVSEEQAICNILFRVKKRMGYPANSGGFKLKGAIYLE